MNAPIPDPYSLPIEELDVSAAALFQQQKQ